MSPDLESFEHDLRVRLDAAAREVVPSVDEGWARLTGDGTDDGVVRLSTHRPRRTRRWQQLAVAAAAVVVVAGVVVAADRSDDVEQRTAATPDGGTDAPAPQVVENGVLPPEPDPVLPGEGGDRPVFGQSAGYETPDAAAVAYLSDRLGAQPGLVVTEAYEVGDGDLARVRWGNFERPLTGGPIAADPIAVGTVLLWQPDGPGTEWVVQASLLDNVPVDDLVAVGSDAEIRGTVVVGQTVDLQVRAADAPVPPVGSGTAIGPGPFTEVRSVTGPGQSVLVVRMVGGSTLGIAELPFVPLRVPIGGGSPADADPAALAAQAVVQVLGREVVGPVVFQGEDIDDQQFEVPTAQGVVRVVVSRVVDGLAVTSLSDVDLGSPGAMIVDGRLLGTLTAPTAGTLRTEVRDGARWSTNRPST